jgi:hypothetical protein
MQLCTYDNPCSTLGGIYRHSLQGPLLQTAFFNFVFQARYRVADLALFLAGPSVEIRLLSGEYSFRNLSIDFSVQNLEFRGQRDCWPAPENSTKCTGSDAVTSEVSIFESHLQSLNMSNIVFRPNGITVNGTILLFDTGNRPLLSSIISNITIDARESSANTPFQMVLNQYSAGNSSISISCVRFRMIFALLR